jgi:hypothetical protein
LLGLVQKCRSQKLKPVIFILSIFLSHQAIAQTIVCIKADTLVNKHSRTLAFAEITPPNRGSMPEQFGYIARDNATWFNFRWKQKDDSKIDVSKGVSMKAIVITLDNDSVEVFQPNRFSKIEPGALYIETAITKEQLEKFKAYKMKKLTLITAKNDQYDLFVFSQQNKADIIKMTDCFLQNL